MKEAIGDRIVKIRKKLGMTQAELAEKVGVGQTTMCAYENGGIDIRLSVLEEIAIILGVSKSYLLEGVSVGLSSEEEELVEAFRGIKDTRIKEMIMEHARRYRV